MIEKKNIVTKNLQWWIAMMKMSRQEKIFEYDGLTGKRYLDEFDYVSFLNNKNTNRRETNGI